MEAMQWSCGEEEGQGRGSASRTAHASGEGAQHGALPSVTTPTHHVTPPHPTLTQPKSHLQASQLLRRAAHGARVVEQGIRLLCCQRARQQQALRLQALAGRLQRLCLVGKGT